MEIIIAVNIEDLSNFQICHLFIKLSENVKKVTVNIQLQNKAKLPIARMKQTSTPMLQYKMSVNR